MSGRAPPAVGRRAPERGAAQSCAPSGSSGGKIKEEVSPSRDDASKIPETGQLINYRNLFLRVLETERPQIKSPADSQMREGIIDQVLFLCVNIVQSASQPHGNSSTRAAISFIRSVLRSPSHLLEMSEYS